MQKEFTSALVYTDVHQKDKSKPDKRFSFQSSTDKHRH